ncbi:hypothetical protein E2C01_050512 [Portunus trituberculatus]|uniref:Reverse transcriptase domain-containing protein n=1 Tax=Portunus trituberculatus TaxID=210409 RepID=A0A5B7G8H1_PORTR|nr:hypothetical protein [Portunus trituberculatus]
MDLLGQHLGHKMTVPQAITLPPSLPVIERNKLTTITTKEGEVRAAFSVLENKQFGFRKAHSAADFTFLLSNQWSDTLGQGKPTAVLALDIAGVFDHVWHTGFVKRLHVARVGSA